MINYLLRDMLADHYEIDRFADDGGRNLGLDKPYPMLRIITHRPKQHFCGICGKEVKDDWEWMFCTHEALREENQT